MSKDEELARKVLKENRVAIFIVAYNAEKFIQKVLQRIPSWIAQSVSEIYVIDDSSKDKTITAVRDLAWPSENAPLQIFQTPYNQGYGGNQRLGYLYALERGFDIVVLLHGDGQYAPEALPQILAPYAEGADAVFGSRFINSLDALKGKMPLYKWVGNRVLTSIQNFLLKSKMSEMHSGYRSYRTSALKKVPFEYNSLNFDFDADIIVQFIGRGLKIVEVPIPTFYGEEICNVNGLQYAWNCTKTAIKYRLMQFEIFYDPKFDFKKRGTVSYSVKQSQTSLHHYIRSLNFEKGVKILDVGGGQGEAVSLAHAQKGLDVTCIDQIADTAHGSVKQFPMNLDLPWHKQWPTHQAGLKFDVVFALDILAQFSNPENGAEEIFKYLKSGGKLFISTGNIAFFPLRLMHLFGQFNYGRRGILDLTHRRLFTTSTFKRLLKNSGFRIDETLGFGPPISDLNPSSTILSALDKIFYFLAQKWHGLFAYQILIVCTRLDSPQELMNQTIKTHQT
jgi:glycosyltransferase involved in cell wall biosynthesis